jgi:hypothetical protein
MPNAQFIQLVTNDDHTSWCKKVICLSCKALLGSPGSRLLQLLWRQHMQLQFPLDACPGQQPLHHVERPLVALQHKLCRHCTKVTGKTERLSKKVLL